VHQQGQRLNELQAALDKANADLERLAALQREQTREVRSPHTVAYTHAAHTVT
jgi:type II secretory pathway component PulJ